jgi:arylsulfatase A-like enzyme
MTGLLPSQHGIQANSQVLDPLVTPSHVRRIRDEAGYHTMVIGKTHLHNGTGHLDEHKGVLRDWGFTDAIELAGPIEQAFRRSAWTDALGDDAYRRFQSYIRVFNEEFRQSRQHETLDPESAPWGLGDDQHLDTFCGRAAADWIRSYQGDQPFYLQVNLPGPHHPFDAPTPWRDLYERGDPAFPVEDFALPSQPWSDVQLAAWMYSRGPNSAEGMRDLQRLYCAKTSLCDAAVGEVLRALGTRDRLDDTLVIYTSDHGEMLGAHNLIGKVVFFEQAIRLPMLVRPPGGSAPWATDAMVDTRDLVATLLDAAGLDVDVEGTSQIARVALGGGDAGAQHGRSLIYSEDQCHAVARTDDHKLVISRASGLAVEQYDLRFDPQELRNVVLEEAWARPRDGLLAQLGAALPGVCVRAPGDGDFDG